MGAQHLFDEAVAPERSGDAFRGRTHADWRNFIGPFGGLIAAQAMNAVLMHPALLGDPVSLTVNFAAGTGSKMSVGVRDALIHVVLKLVLGRAWSRIAKLPEILNELIARVVRGQFQESGAFFLGNEISDVPFQPFLVAFFQLLLLGCGRF